MSRRLAPTILLLAMIAVAGCGSGKTASGFDADLGPIDPDLSTALAEGDDPERVPEVQRNFLTGCVKGFDQSIPELEPVQRAGLIQVCGCTYEQLVGHAYELAASASNGPSASEDADALDRAAFEVFTGIEDDLRAGDGTLTEDVQLLVRTCIRTEAGL